MARMKCMSIDQVVATQKALDKKMSGVTEAVLTGQIGGMVILDASKDKGTGGPKAAIRWIIEQDGKPFIITYFFNGGGAFDDYFQDRQTFGSRRAAERHAAQMVQTAKDVYVMGGSSRFSLETSYSVMRNTQG